MANRHAGRLPQWLDGAQVLEVAVLDNVLYPSWHAMYDHFGREIPSPARLAIVSYPDEQGVYLFHCDADWRVLYDSYHESTIEAKGFARTEAAAVNRLWRSLRTRARS